MSRLLRTLPRRRLACAAFAAASLLAAGACSPARAPSVNGTCTAIGPLGDLAALAATHPPPLIVVGGQVVRCPCGQDRDLGGDTEGRRLGGDVEAHKLGGDTEGRRLGGDVEGRKLGGDTEGRRLGGDVEGRKLGGDTEGRRLGGDVEGRKLGGDLEQRRLGGDTMKLSCTLTPTCPGFVVRSLSPVAFHDGAGVREAPGGCVPR